MYALIPQGLDIDQLPYISQARKKAPRRANVQYVLSTILSKQIQSGDECVPIYSRILQSYVRPYRVVLDQLISAGWVSVHPYSGGYLWRSFGEVGECTRYSVSDELRALKTVEVKLPERFGRIYDEHLKRERERAELEAPWSTPLREALQAVRISYDKARKFIENEHRAGRYSQEQYNALVYAIHQFVRVHEGGVLPFSYRANCGRVFSPFTNLPKDLRQFVSVSGSGELMEVDVRCSQPFFLCALMRSEGVRCDALKDVTSGEFYDRIAEACNLTRDEVKQPTLALIYERNRPAEDVSIRLGGLANLSSAAVRLLVREALISLYPDLWKYVCEFKERNDYKELALNMQRNEGELILKRVACEALERFGCFVGTIHDSIVVPEQYAESVRELIKQRAVELWGVAPMMRVRKL